MKKLLVLGAAFGLAAAPALAQPTEAEIDRFVTAVEAIGCEVHTDAHASAVESRTGFSDAKLAEIVAVLLNTERAVIPASAEGLRLTTEGCS